MTTNNAVDALGALIRRRGLPERPVAAVQVSEIRSDQFLTPLPTLEPGYETFALSPLVTEWRYTVPYDKMEEFQKFLADNEVFIATSCRSVMKGVKYHGTYIGAVGQRNAYRTLWGYESWESHKEWRNVIEAPGTRLYEVISTLRGYWIADPQASQDHIALAGQVKLDEHPFLSLTVKTSKS